MTEQSDPAGGDRLAPAGRSEADLLAWGIKASFLRYVAGVGGDIVCTDGAVEVDGGFGFPVGAVGPDGAVSASGSVLIRAHGGLLNVQLRDPQLTPGGDGEVLTVAADTGRLAVATIASRAPDAPQTAAPQLHPDAVVLFDGTYPPGTELDPVRFLRRSADSPPDRRGL